MKEISLHILDIAQNSISAKATVIKIEIIEATEVDILECNIRDNGIGMEQDLLESICDPFSTTRITRKVGMGIPLLKASAERCDGCLKVKSMPNKGTEVFARFKLSHIDRAPIGDMTITLITLIVSNPFVDFIYEHRVDSRSFEFSTVKIKEILRGVSINNHEVILWLKDYLNEGIISLYGGVSD